MNIEKKYDVKKIIYILFIITAYIGPGLSYNNIYAFHFMIIINLLVYFYFNQKIEIRYDFFLLPWILLLVRSLLSVVQNIFDYDIIIFYTIILLIGMTIITTMVYLNNEKLEFYIKLFKNLVVIELLLTMGFFIIKSEFLNFIRINTNVFFLSSVQGFRGNPNNFGVVILIFTPFFYINKINVPYFIISTFLIVFTHGRIVQLVYIIELVFIFFLLCNRKQKKKIVIVVLVVLVIVFFLYKDKLITIIEYLKNIIELIKSMFNGDKILDNSVFTRNMLIRQALQKFSDNYYIGLGIGITDHLPTINRIDNLHNFWIQLLVEFGLFISMIFIFIWIYSCYNLVKNKNKNNYALFISNVAFIISVISISTVYYFLPMYILYSLNCIAMREFYENTDSCTSQ